MPTGQRALNAKARPSLISKIMTEHPTPSGKLQPIAPAALHRLIMKCLAKDPDERWQCAADVASELRWVAESDGAGGSAASAQETAGGRQPLWGAVGVPGVATHGGTSARGGVLPATLRPP